MLGRVKMRYDTFPALITYSAAVTPKRDGFDQLLAMQSFLLMTYLTSWHDAE